MTKLILGETEYDIPKYHFRELRLAGPYLDRINAERRNHAEKTAEEQSKVTVGELASDLSAIWCFLAVGVRLARGLATYKSQVIIDQEIAEIADELEGAASFSDTASVTAVVNAIMEEAGLRKSTSDPTSSPPSGELAHEQQ